MARARPLVCAALLALTAVPARAAIQEHKKADPLKVALALYRANRLTEALPLFEQAAVADSTDATNLAWLAETLRRLERFERAIVVGRRALGLSACHAFAHTVLGTAFNPQYGAEGDYDSVWVHLRRAVECDPDDGDAWLNIWGEALRRGDRATEEQALRRLKETGFLSRTAVSYNRWLLRDLPPNAVSIANGDLDMYPALMLQLTDRFRRDVAIVSLPMLNLWWYVQHVHTRYGLPLPADSMNLATRPMCGSGGADTVCLANLVLGEWRRLAVAGALIRPLAIVSPDGFPPGPGEFVRTGPLALLRSNAASVVDTASVRRSLRNLDGRDFAEPSATRLDRSAIRISSAAQKSMPLHVAWAADLYGRELIGARRLREARDVLTWLRRFVNDAGLDTLDGRALVEGFAAVLETAERNR